MAGPSVQRPKLEAAQSGCARCSTLASVAAPSSEELAAATSSDAWLSLDVVQEARHEQDEAIGYLRKQAREHLETIYYWLAALLLGEMLTATR